jgi:hypothetical protein
VRKSKILVSLVLTFTFGFNLCGCLYLKHGETETINFQSDPPGAQLVVNGTPYGNTPTDVTLSRCQEYQARVSKPGYEPTTLQISRGIKGVDSLLLFCDSLLIIPVIVDGYFCAGPQLNPNPVNVTLIPAPGATK